MAIKKETLATALVLLGMAADAAAATTMIDDTAEHAPAVPEGTLILNKDQTVVRDKAQYEKGKKAGEGMTIDAIFAKELPEYTGKKDGETLAAQLLAKGQGEAGKDTDTKVKERDKTIESLRANITKIEQTAAQQATILKKKERETQMLMWTADLMPEHFTPEEWVGLIGMGVEVVDVEGEGGGVFAKRNGEFIQDPKLLTKTPAKDAIRAYVTERKLAKEVKADDNKGGGGRGGADSKGPVKGIRTRSQMDAYLAENKIDPKSEKARTEISRITTEATDFDWNS